MLGTHIPTNPKDSRFGWPKIERLEEFKSKQEAWASASDRPTHRVVIQGQTKDIPIIRVHQNIPKYRLENGRTASAQVEYLAKNASARKDMFEGDSELWDAQEAQHGLLLKLAEKSDLRKYFENTSNRQVDPILVDHLGFVVNGNRRLSTWRDLYDSDKVKYKHFEYVDLVVLPQVDNRAIDRLEAELQIEKDIKANYTWDAEANMMLAKREREHYSDKDLAELYGKKEPEVRDLLDMHDYAEEWLKSRGKENMWSLVSGSELAFKRIVTTRGKVGGTGRQQLFKEAAFALIDNPEEVKDSLHDAINGMANNIEPIVEKLKAGFAVTEVAVDNETDELFGGGTKKAGEASDLALSKEIAKPENASKAREIIVEFIESEKQLKRDTKTAEKLLDSCSRANAALEDGIKLGFCAETKIEGVEAQLAQLEVRIQKIRDFLEKSGNASN
ncbi:hypothetical protein [Paraburkholderia aspalathi]|uniref:hypothetical protein n=1 Tax=Paraburkholderia aspalathi TaxID=1324617 RepID=UPI001B185979|nr:hypothetical protein [Paraburkholderia aspalathi]CAE6819768.1 hypothetical protein R20943_06102 [Paraburkholderia aspalathi]